MTVDVVFFARAKELVGAGQVQLALEVGATVGDLRVQLAQLYPELARLLPHCTVAVDHEYSTDDSPLKDGCEVGCIPPVSGG